MPLFHLRERITLKKTGQKQMFGARITNDSRRKLFSGEIAELKAGFKHEMHFNNLNENCQTEVLSWAVDSNVSVPPHYMTEASIIIEEMNYRGSYTVVSRLAGSVIVSIRR